MGRRPPALILLFLILAAPAVAWGQPGGDAAHSGVWDAPGVLDVLGNILLSDTPIKDAGQGVVETGAGFVVMVRDGGTCSLVQGGATIASVPCSDGRLLGQDDAGHLLLCVEGRVDAPLLHAFTPDGTEAWTAGPARPAVDPISLLPVDLVTMQCTGAALDGGRAYVAYTDGTGNHTIESIHLADGGRDWAVTIPNTAFTGRGIDAPIPYDLLPVNTGTGFVPQAIVRTGTGLLVTGRLLDVSAGGVDAASSMPSGIPAAAWLTPEGTLQGTYLTDAGDGDVLLPVSLHPAGHGDLAAAVLGMELLVVNPRSSQAVPIPLGTLSYEARTLAAPVWSDAGLAVPGESGAFLFEADPLDAERWTGMGGGRLQDLLATPHGAALALVTGIGHKDTAALVRFDIHDGATLQALPLLMRAEDLGAHLLPLQNGTLLAWSRNGTGILLGTTTMQAPDVSLNDAYPGLGEAVLITASAPGEARLLVAWGDGLVQDLDGRLSHNYRDPGTHRITVTAVYPDGRTASTQRVVSVGGFPPPQENLLERAFNDQNWEKTVTIGGIVVSTIGILVGVVTTTRGRRRLERELRNIDRIQDHGRQDAFMATRDLHDYRQRIRTDMAKGRLQEGQFQVLESRAREVLESLRERVLGGFAGSVSSAFERAVDLALRDGKVDAQEAEVLRDAAGRERIPAQERERLVRLIDGWVA